ncbi:Zn-ribbon domain-containing OB-fold protein [Halovivax gelatinilyticus]|uniref:Zn-ribbon domain-containing OB-fold protein n=1 Tax=Halovivax gelatinilyticus TaxID=2961597 RepID=UPI0020CA3607|nr:OB-fold domain-containing protein [Halovivax gelatinilyticus]
MSDAWEPRPVPDVTPETAEYWAAAADGDLLVGTCEACEAVFHYPRAHCPDCFSEAVSTTTAAGTARLYTFASPERIEGWPDEHRPLIVAQVELDEGPRLITNVVDADPSALSIGDRVAVRFVPTDRDDVAIPVFEPVD